MEVVLIFTSLFLFLGGVLGGFNLVHNMFFKWMDSRKAIQASKTQKALAASKEAEARARQIEAQARLVEAEARKLEAESQKLSEAIYAKLGED